MQSSTQRIAHCSAEGAWTARFTGLLAPICWRSAVVLAGCRTGDAKATRGHKLPAKHIIHTVGPVWKGGNAGEDDLLVSCYRRSLEIADQLKVKSIAFPAISTGIYGFPKVRAATIAVTEIRHYTGGIERLIFVCFDSETADIYRNLLTI